jgi:hypothetical protein
MQMKSFLEKAVKSAAFAGIVVLLLPLAALARPPSYAQLLHEQKISGVITSLSGKYGLQIHDNRGYFDKVEMHQGTVITPTGLTLQPGMRVRIYGEPENGTFMANEIDTPYHLQAYVPVPGPYWGPYWGAGFWHPLWVW